MKQSKIAIIGENSAGPVVGRGSWLVLLGFFVLVALGVMWAKGREAAIQNLAEYPVPKRYQRVPLEELLTNGAAHNGKLIETEGYLRFVTWLMHYGVTEENELSVALGLNREPTTLALYALSPEPLPLDWKSRGATVGRTGETNLLIRTHVLIAGEATRSDGTSFAPRRRVIGRYRYDHPRHDLLLMHWASD